MAASKLQDIPSKEWGDYQTPLPLCLKICKFLKDEGWWQGLTAVLEPTCGEGNFLKAASTILNPALLAGIEINPCHVRKARMAVPQAKIVEGNIFGLPTKTLCNTDKVLILGNPPWVTSSDLKFNLPLKSNFKALRGIEAMTGSANFDICESVILQLAEEYKGSSSVLSLLCKTTAARRIMVELERRENAVEKMQMLLIDPKIFKVDAPLCLLLIKLAPFKRSGPLACEVRDFESGELVDTLTATGEILQRAAASNLLENLEGQSPLTWRSGVKHDCSLVLELEQKEGRLFNKLGKEVEIEPDLIYPLVKSSSFKHCVLTQFSRFVLVTQQRPGMDTAYIEEQYPKTMAYLEAHRAYFARRQSIIYKDSAPFAIFGIGPYSFAPFKVGLSGFYKTPRFALFYSDKPVMADDTVYFLSFEERQTAYAMMLLLNSPLVPCPCLFRCKTD